MKTFALPTQDKYPKKIHFGTETYKIRFKKNLDCFGITNWETKTITIKDGLSPRELLSTVIHELIHLVEFEKPLRIKHKTVYKLEKAILDLLIDNFL